MKYDTTAKFLSLCNRQADSNGSRLPICLRQAVVSYTILRPAPLVYVRAYSLEPTTITPSQITWQQDNTLSLPGVALFQDPRVYALYLPYTQRGQ